MTVGFDAGEFWDQTFRTHKLAMGAKAEAARLEHDRRAWLAFHIAALSRAKRLGRAEFEKLAAKRERKTQTWQEQFVIMQKWAADQKRAKELREKLNGR